MDVFTHPLVVVAGSAILVLAACMGWYRRQLRLKERLIARLRNDSHQLDEQLKQAKQQIGTLKT